jgi:glycosyltransferase involved in cell wall biosynthesis
MLLTIITVNLNNVKGLNETLSSVAAQTFKGFEYIVIDGGSVDGSVELIKESADKINYWVSEGDKGIYNAMNKGLQKATGEYILFMNSGDSLYNSQVLETFKGYLDGTDIIYGDFIFLYPDGRKDLYKNDKDITYISFLERERHLCHQAVIMSRKSIDKAGGAFDESLKIVADWKMFAIALLQQNASFKYVPETLSYFEAGGISLQKSSIERITDEQQKVIRESFPLFNKDMERILKTGTSFSEIFNSSYLQKLLKLRKKAVSILRK